MLLVSIHTDPGPCRPACTPRHPATHTLYRENQFLPTVTLMVGRQSTSVQEPSGDTEHEIFHATAYGAHATVLDLVHCVHFELFIAFISSSFAAATRATRIV